MANLVLDSLELSTALQTVPKNGAPSSVAYNDFMREVLTDLTVISDFLNENLLPMLAALPLVASGGLHGGAVYANPLSQDAVFYNANSSQPYTVADVFAELAAAQSKLQSSVKEVDSRLTQLQTRLSTNTQTDTTRVIQTFSDRLKAIEDQANLVFQSALSAAAKSDLIKTFRLAIDVGADADYMANVDWPSPYPDNNYTVSALVEDATGDLSVVNFQFLSNGSGVQVRVRNQNTTQTRTGVLHVIARGD